MAEAYVITCHDFQRSPEFFHSCGSFEEAVRIFENVPTFHCSVMFVRHKDTGRFEKLKVYPEVFHSDRAVRFCQEWLSERLSEEPGVAPGLVVPTNGSRVEEPGVAPGLVVPTRMAPEVEEQISILPFTKWADVVPTCNLPEELLQNAGIRQVVPAIDAIVDDIEMKLMELEHVEQALQMMKDMRRSERGAIVGYTHDLMQPEGKKEGNLYFECNRGIKVRDALARVEMMKTWGVFVHFMVKGLSKLPNATGTGYRGLPNKTTIIAEYKRGRPIQWGSFTSIAAGPQGLEVAKGFTDKDHGIILKIAITCGKELGPLGFFPTEGEILLPPSAKLIVTSEPYVVDGYTFLEMCQEEGKTFVW